MSLKDVPVRARLWAPDRSLPRFFGRLLLFLSDSTLRLLPSTFGRWKRAEVSLKRAVLHPRATISMVFVAEGFPSSIRHSALRPWATERRGRVALLCRASPSGAGQSGVIVPGELGAASCSCRWSGSGGGGRMVVRPLYRPLYPAYSFDIWKFLFITVR